MKEWMRSFNKKVWSICLTFMLVIALLPITVKADAGYQNSKDGEWAYEFVNYDKKEEINIIGYKGSKTEIIVPSNIDGHSVAYVNLYGISEYYNAKLNYDNVEKLSFENGVKSIKSIENFPNITKLSFPDSVTQISYIKNCAKLKEIEIPKNVTNVGPSGYGTDFIEDCPLLEKITVAKGSKSFTASSSGFVMNKNHTRIVLIPEGIEKIVVPKTVKQFDRTLFQNLIKLKTIEFKGDVSSFYEEMFIGCKSLITVKTTKKITWVSKNAFKDCVKLVNMPEFDLSWSNIDTGAFQNCESLKSLKLSGTNIQKNAFKGCKKLVITCPKNSLAYDYAKKYGIKIKIIN